MKHKSNVINTIVTVCCETIRTELQKNFKAKFSFRKSINGPSFERERKKSCLSSRNRESMEYCLEQFRDTKHIDSLKGNRKSDK